MLILLNMKHIFTALYFLTMLTHVTTADYHVYTSKRNVDEYFIQYHL